MEVVQLGNYLADCGWRGRGSRRRVEEEGVCVSLFEECAVVVLNFGRFLKDDRH